MILILSHGNASVESGFSVNNDTLVENFEKISLVAHRRVYDSVKNLGGTLQVKFNPDLIKSARSARTRYRQALEEKRKVDSEASLEISRK